MEIFLLSAFGVLLGLINAISGGGGVFALPAFLALGLSPVNAIALNLVSDVGVVLGAIPNFYRKKNNVDWKFALIMLPILMAGAFLGAKVIVNLEPEITKKIILIGVLLGMIFLLKPIKKNEKAHTSSKAKLILGYFLLFLIGMWDGSIAIAGTTFALIVIVHMFNKSFLQGRIAYAAAGAPGTLIAAIIVYMESSLSLSWTLSILISNIVGAWIGSHIAVKFGDGIIKKFIVVMAVLIVAKVLFFPD